MKSFKQPFIVSSLLLIFSHTVLIADPCRDAVLGETQTLSTQEKVRIAFLFKHGTGNLAQTAGYLGVGRQQLIQLVKVGKLEFEQDRAVFYRKAPQRIHATGSQIEGRRYLMRMFPTIPEASLKADPYDRASAEKEAQMEASLKAAIEVVESRLRKLNADSEVFEHLPSIVESLIDYIGRNSSGGRGSHEIIRISGISVILESLVRSTLPEMEVNDGWVEDFLLTKTPNLLEGYVRLARFASWIHQPIDHLDSNYDVQTRILSVFKDLPRRGGYVLAIKPAKMKDLVDPFAPILEITERDVIGAEPVGNFEFRFLEGIAASVKR